MYGEQVTLAIRTFFFVIAAVAAMPFQRRSLVADARPKGCRRRTAGGGVIWLAERSPQSDRI
jgi:hypothetical protein